MALSKVSRPPVLTVMPVAPDSTPAPLSINSPPLTVTVALGRKLPFSTSRPAPVVVRLLIPPVRKTVPPASMGTKYNALLLFVVKYPGSWLRPKP